MTSAIATVFVSVFILTNIASASITPLVLSDEFINIINSKQNSWEAGHNFEKDISVRHLHRLVGTKLIREKPHLLPIKLKEEIVENLPESFDAREHWPQCASLKEIRDQGGCGSCWAISGASAITDRICISANGSKQVHVSVEDILDCAGKKYNCDGGPVETSWEYWIRDGVVSGGNYGSNEGCKPYSMPTCKIAKDCKPVHVTPPCVRKCESGYNITYENDKHFGENGNALEGEEEIKAAIFQNGPVTTGFIVYTDFFNYKKGVYRHVAGSVEGAHAVKILGWGEENGNKYWLVANSWNTTWGDNGFFKIVRGENHCEFESYAYAAIPKK